VIGEKANATRPEIEQIMLAAPAGLDGEALERALFLCRKRIEKRVHAARTCRLLPLLALGQVLIYKGMFLAEHIDEFYPDLPTSASRRAWRSSTSAIRPTPSPSGGWPSRSGCWPTTARSTRSRATSTG
jgi:hypothetical protein